jgi:hypothetical protein
VWSADLDVATLTHTYPEAIGTGTAFFPILVTQDDLAFRYDNEVGFEVAHRDAAGWSEGVRLGASSGSAGIVLTTGGRNAHAIYTETDEGCFARRFDPAGGTWGEPSPIWTETTDGIFGASSPSGHVVVALTNGEAISALHFDPDRERWEPLEPPTVDFHCERLPGVGGLPQATVFSNGDAVLRRRIHDGSGWAMCAAAYLPGGGDHDAVARFVVEHPDHHMVLEQDNSVWAIWRTESELMARHWMCSRG